MLSLRTRDPINPISLISGEFINRGREETYFTSQLKQHISGTRITLLILGVVFALFAIPDFLSNSDLLLKFSILTGRLLALSVIVIIYFLLRREVSRRRYVFFITICELSVVSVFLYAISVYENPKILLQTFSAIMLIIAFYMIYNSFLAILTVNLFMLAGFAFVTQLFHEPVEPLERAAIIVYLLVTIVLSTVAFSRTERLKRRQTVLMEQLESLSVTDALTRCYNRMKFNDELHNEIERSRRYGISMSLILYDYDYFKTINDEFGHPAGDLVLIRTSRLVRQSIRTVDVLARWGGEEFMLLLPDTPLKPATDLANRIREKIAACDCGPVSQVTCSFGVTELREGDTMESILQRVDDLLYMAKQEGRNQVVSG
ncbi:MAG: GGDEF domain-containing protein [Eubacteriales bacterium]|jgi:diguanylate cyclase (GGDEF)-like protein|nr:GGDEF domain-containing protein [Eubacteriales bacterium]